MPDVTFSCFSCGRAIQVLAGQKVLKRDTCSDCDADLHCCKNCRFLRFLLFTTSAVRPRPSGCDPRTRETTATTSRPGRAWTSPASRAFPLTTSAKSGFDLQSVADLREVWGKPDLSLSGSDWEAGTGSEKLSSSREAFTVQGHGAAIRWNLPQLPVPGRLTWWNRSGRSRRWQRKPPLGPDPARSWWEVRFFLGRRSHWDAV